MRQGNGTFLRLTHMLEGDRGQTWRNRERTGKRGGGGPIIPLMPTARNGKKTMYGLVLPNLDKAEFVSSRRDRSSGEVGR